MIRLLTLALIIKRAVKCSLILTNAYVITSIIHIAKM